MNSAKLRILAWSALAGGGQTDRVRQMARSLKNGPVVEGDYREAV